jgi:hypothetical protein
MEVSMVNLPGFVFSKPGPCTFQWYKAVLHCRAVRKMLNNFVWALLVLKESAGCSLLSYLFTIYLT